MGAFQLYANITEGADMLADVVPGTPRTAEFADGRTVTVTAERTGLRRRTTWHVTADPGPGWQPIRGTTNRRALAAVLVGIARARDAGIIIAATQDRAREHGAPVELWDAAALLAYVDEHMGGLQRYAASLDPHTPNLRAV